MTWTCVHCLDAVPLEQLRPLMGHYLCGPCYAKAVEPVPLQRVCEGEIERDEDGMPTVLYPRVRR